MATTWVKIEDKLPGNQKVRAVSVAARWAYVASICYCGANLTDGAVPKSALPLLDATPRIARELVGAGLWHETADGWEVHDYLQHNRPRAKVEALRRTASENGAKGLAIRYGFSQRAASKTPSELPSELPSERLAKPLQNALSASASASSRSPEDLPGAAEAEQQNASKPLALRECFDLWTAATGTTVTRQMGDGIESWLERAPPGWVQDAIRETGDSGARSWKYTSAILERWMRDGRDTDGGPANGRNRVPGDGRGTGGAGRAQSRHGTGGPRLVDENGRPTRSLLEALGEPVSGDGVPPG